MFDRRRVIIIATCVVAVGLLVFRGTQHHGATQPNPRVDRSSASEMRDHNPVPSSQEHVIRLRPDEVLATVNGHDLRVEDVFATKSAEGEMEVGAEAYRFLLDRAIDRELVLQNASAHGVALNESQREQLAAMKAARNRFEPGGIRRLNDSEHGSELEARDAEAFMLQTKLLSLAGASPNVTDEQVLAFYHEHSAQFGELPSDPASHDEAWKEIDFRIRQQLASTVRADYQTQLAGFMNQLRSSATLQMHLPN